MKNYIIALVIFLVAIACQPQPITESEVKAVIEGFFDALDIAQRDSVKLDDYVTDDFIIHEAGKKLTKQEFQDFIDEVSVGLKESAWVLSDYRISIDNNSAHASFYNKGMFIKDRDTVTTKDHVEWLESAYLIKNDGQLKIKFYFSDYVKSERDTL